MLVQLILTVNLTAAFQGTPFAERKQSLFTTERKKSSDGNIRPCSRDNPLSSSPDFLGKQDELSETYASYPFKLRMIDFFFFLISKI